MFKNRYVKGLVYLLVGIILIGKYIVTPDKTLEELAPKYAAAPSQFMTLNGMKIHYRDEGAGTPIVLIHGTGASLHTWNDWTKDLVKDYRVIRLDLPAYGLTGQDPQNRYSSKDYVDLLDAFLTELKVDQFHLVGNSLGGLISWLYASYYPEKVEKLVLLDPSGFPFKNTPMVIKMAKTPVLNNFIRYVTPRSFIEKNIQEVYYDPTLIKASTLDRYYDLTLYEGNRDAFIDRAFIEREDYRDRLSLIKAPTLILWGENDAWIPVSDAPKFKAAIENAQVVIMPETGHVPMEEKPKESLAVVADFLAP
ncbi:MAG: alpha/beta hydrolase [Flavobacteriaceae bacterium]|nr:alpha/beta hydrolase [Flavobacteriaceae bacterium]